MASASLLDSLCLRNQFASELYKLCYVCFSFIDPLFISFFSVKFAINLRQNTEKPVCNSRF